MSDLFDVVADATRRDIVELLNNQSGTPAEMSVGQLVEALGITQPTVSKHLKVLRESGVVTVREEGQHRYYRLDASALKPVTGWLSGVAGSHADGDVNPFVDLNHLGRAVGGLIHDGVSVVNDLVTSLRT
jgi:ArsR family transcriptional regulator, arsenate/arsenite/antimonite-responsive transcriptional repressor